MRNLLLHLFNSALQAAQAATGVPRYLPAPPQGRLVVVGAGKAAAAMARAVEQHWAGPLIGLVVTRHGYEQPCERIQVLTAAHPVPDAQGLAAGQAILRLVQSLQADDHVLALFSGGGSALMPAPLPGLSLADKQQLSRELLRCGASIREINCVRRHLSALKGGRLAAACAPVPVTSLLISDVPGDRLSDIASGPTVADASSRQEAEAILARYGLEVPEAVRACLRSEQAETIKPGDARLAGCVSHIIASPQQALDAAAQAARARGWSAYSLGDALEGEAREVAQVMAGIVCSIVRHGQPFAAPCVLLSGGETTVTVRGRGRGGRNVEFLLALALALRAMPGVYALAADTDGVDGAEEVAGGWIGPDTLERARQLGLSPQALLDNNDAHRFFAALGDQLITGPTCTNVNDFRAIVITEQAYWSE